MTNYIELTSSRRNRNQYPNPAFFTTTINDTGMRDKTTALDPVSNAYPIKSWYNGFNTKFPFNSRPEFSGVDYLNPRLIEFKTVEDTFLNQKIFKCYCDNDDLLQQERNFYINSVLRTTISSVHYTFQIKSYTYLGKDNSNQDFCIIELYSPINMTILSSGTDWMIYDTVLDLAPYTTNNVPTVFVPNAPNINDYYLRYFYRGENGNNQFVNIVDYNDNTHLLSLFNSLSSPSEFPFNLTLNSEKPIEVRGIRIKNKKIQLLETTIFTDFILNYIRLSNEPMNNQFVKSVSPYGDSGRMLEYTNLDLIFDTSLAVLSATTITLLQPIEKNLSGLFLTLVHTSQKYAYEITSNTDIIITLASPLILNYTAQTNVSYVRTLLTDHDFGVDIGNDLDTNFIFDMMYYSYDNYAPLNYNGFNYGSSDCFQISIMNLIVPNKVLKTGGIITQYPYLYVELSTSTVQSGHIYTNNNNAKKALFRVVITDTSIPSATSIFTKLSGYGMIQTIKFKPNDNLTFRVFIPTGETVEFTDTDFFSPSPPNPEIQVSAVFSILRV